MFFYVSILVYALTKQSCFPVQGTLPEILWLSMWCDALSSPKLLKYPHQLVPFVFTTRWKQILTFNKRKCFLFSKELLKKLISYKSLLPHVCYVKSVGAQKMFCLYFFNTFFIKLVYLFTEFVKGNIPICESLTQSCFTFQSWFSLNNKWSALFIYFYFSSVWLCYI